MRSRYLVIALSVVFFSLALSACSGGGLPQPPTRVPKPTATPAYKPEEVLAWVGEKVRQVAENFDPKKPTCFAPNGVKVQIDKGVVPYCARVYWDGDGATISVFYISDELVSLRAKENKITTTEARNRLYFDCQTADGSKFKGNMILVSQKDGWIVTGPAPCIVVDGSKVATTDRIFWEIGQSRLENRLLVRSGGKIWSILGTARYRVPDPYNWPYGTKAKAMLGTDVASDGLPVQATDTPALVPGEDVPLDNSSVESGPLPSPAPTSTSLPDLKNTSGSLQTNGIVAWFEGLSNLAKVALFGVILLIVASYLFLRSRAAKRRSGSH